MQTQETAQTGHQRKAAQKPHRIAVKKKRKPRNRNKQLDKWRD